MEAAGPIAGETCVVSTRAYVFHHNPQQGKWDPLGDRSRSLSRVQLLKRRHSNQSTFRLLARLENAPAHAPPILSENLDLHSDLQATDKTFYQLQLGNDKVYGLKFSSEADAEVFSTYLRSVLTPPTPTTPERNIEDDLPPAQLAPKVAQKPVHRPQFSTMQDYSSRPQRRQPLERIPDNSSQSVPPVYSQQQPMIGTYVDELGSAIADGNIAVAQNIVAELAKKKARLKMEVDPEGKPLDPQLHKLRVMIEDRETSGGSFVLEARMSASIISLKRKVYEQHRFPVELQRWFHNRRILKDDEHLDRLGINPRDAVFNLYLLSSKSVGITREQFEQREQRYMEQPQQMYGSQRQNPPPLPQRTGTLPRQHSATGGFPVDYAPPLEHAEFQQRLPQFQPQPFAGEIVEIQDPLRPRLVGTRQQPAALGQIAQELDQRRQAGNQPNIPPRQQAPAPAPQPVGWTCKMCTFFNKPARPGCEMCGATKPDDYVVPTNYKLTAEEQRIMDEERQQHELTVQAEEARRQQERERSRQNFQQLMQVADTDLVTNEDEFECPVCFVDIEPGEGVRLRECLHQFCKECLAEHVRRSQEADVRCPYMDDDFACDAPLTEREIKQLLDADDLKRWHDRGIAIAETQMGNAFHCKTPDCHGWCVYDDNVNDFDCPVCTKRNCLLCKAIHHPEMNCKEYQDDLKRRAANDVAAQKTQEMLDQMVQKGDAMHCPKCKIIVQKKDGCDWIRCSMCKTEICWATKGPRWGPKGKGDTSGGCKCGVNGRCHPNCKNCH